MVKHTQETKEKIRLAMLGQKHTLGLKHTEETKIKMSLVKKGISPKNLNELIEKGKATRFQKGNKINIGNKHFLGKKVSEEHKRKISLKNTGRRHTEEELKKISEAGKGRKSWNKNIMGEEYLRHFKEGKIWNEGLTKDTDERIKKMIEKITGPNSPNWLGGKSFEPYTKEWNIGFRKTIKIRDAFMCQKCSMFEEDNIKLFGKPLDVHHIDYNKKLSIPSNCVTLCSRCHGETTVKNREGWILFYKSLLKEKYGYNYEDKVFTILPSENKQ